MPAGLPPSAPRAVRRAAGAGATTSRPLGTGEIEREVDRLVADQLGGAPIALLSVASASDGSYAVLEGRVSGEHEGARLERAAASVAAALDPMLLGARSGAEVRVTFSGDAPRPERAAAAR